MVTIINKRLLMAFRKFGITSLDILNKSGKGFPRVPIATAVSTLGPYGCPHHTLVHLRPKICLGSPQERTGEPLTTGALKTVLRL